MEDKKSMLILEDRHDLRITGVYEVLIFGETAAEFSTELGALQITGTGLHMEKLDLDQKEAHLKGQIISLYYPEDAPRERKKGMLSRLFS
jgi:sporulation protein YabP